MKSLGANIISGMVPPLLRSLCARPWATVTTMMTIVLIPATMKGPSRLLLMAMVACVELRL